MPATMFRRLGAVASQARSFSRQSFPVSNELRGAPMRNTKTSTPCRRTLSTTPSISLPFRPTRPTFLRNTKTPSRQPPKTTTRHSSTEANPENGPKPYWNPHKAKRHWPPDLKKLSEKHQFRMERKYRRRAKLKYARPRWMKATKIAQWSAIGFTIVYSVLFLEWEGEDSRGNPFEGIRKYFFDSANSIFTRPTSAKKGPDPSTTES